MRWKRRVKAFQAEGTACAKALGRGQEQLEGRCG